MANLDTHHEKVTEACPKCASPLHIRNGKQGPFLGCSAYPECDYLRPLHEKSEVKKVLTGSSCPLCKNELVLKQGRFGLFIGCSDYPNCEHTAQLSEQNKPQENPEKEQSIACPSCKNGHLIQRQSRFGKTFYACDNYPACKYAVNDKPVNEPCPECDWPIMVERKTNTALRLICPKKSCGYRSKPL
ncbi:DNA topoisomerase family protein [Psychromonas algicola]|uniref:DNA topoisomerase family protein n=1 Tax=Psychromonas algicola TaxID=2555642 RepID=UPI0010686610|nr:topoisomerase DNA-binding C4 zinc finger domain-containing protein [Psychromonas sp. RZ5]TEW52160.1 hypothetical protein E2R67_03740 [Psychromonas sp. RZ5]